MPYNANDLLRAVRRAAAEAVAAEKPSGIYFGTVESAAPLAVRIGQKLLLGENQLLRSTLVRDFDVSMSPGDAGGTVKRVHLGLAAGDKVLLLREQGGQRYVLLDRVREG